MLKEDRQKDSGGRNKDRQEGVLGKRNSICKGLVMRERRCLQAQLKNLKVSLRTNYPEVTGK